MPVVPLGYEGSNPFASTITITGSRGVQIISLVLEIRARGSEAHPPDEKGLLGFHRFTNCCVEIQNCGSSLVVDDTCLPSRKTKVHREFESHLPLKKLKWGNNREAVCTGNVNLIE